MILLSSEGKGLIKIKSWQEIVERPGYTTEVNAEAVKLEKIIGEYSLSEKPKCGLKGCATPHNRGYLVVCADGKETNIGNVCGKRIFGVDFEEIKARFKRDLNEQTHREEIVRFRNQIDPIIKRISFLKDGDRQGSWCFGELQFHAERAYDATVLNRLMERAKRNDGKLVNVVSLDARERDIAEAQDEKRQYREIEVATIVGISSLKDYKKLRKLLSVDLGSDLTSFLKIDEKTLRTGELNRWYKWTQSLKNKIKDVENIIDEAHRFLVPSNIEIIRRYKNLI